jgi:hypothetical protein
VSEFCVCGVAVYCSLSTIGLLYLNVFIIESLKCSWICLVRSGHHLRRTSWSTLKFVIVIYKDGGW